MKSENQFVTSSRIPFFEIAKQLIQNNDTVLDIGAGDGSFAKFCERNDIYMVDGNLQTINKLKFEFPNYYYTELPNLPFTDFYFNVVHCSHVIEHLQPQQLYDLLQEIDKVLTPNGYLIISTPLLTDRFYDDLSHIKPYNPSIFYRYLSNTPSNNLTRPKISISYQIVDLVYRYEARKIFSLSERNKWDINKIISLIPRILFKVGIKKYVKTGYTIVLQKNII
jgi:ubiquinone/menaquinone biosynthesis C-methylase UbiE